MKPRTGAKPVIIVLCLIVIAALGGRNIYQYIQYRYCMREQQELVKSARDSASAACTHIQYVLEEGVQERTMRDFEMVYGAFCSMDSFLYAIDIDGSDIVSYWRAYSHLSFDYLGRVALGRVSIPETDIQAPFWEDGVIDENERRFLEELSAELLHLIEQVDATNDAKGRPQMDPEQFSALAQGIVDIWNPYLDDQEETSEID